MRLKTSLPSEWDKQAKIWDHGIHSPRWPHYHYYMTFDMYLPRLLRGCRNILELGCGTADSIPSLGLYIEQISALDFSEEMIRTAKRKINSSHFLEKVHLLIADAHKVPFKDTSFDAVFSRGALVDYVEDATTLFSEVWRVLRPEGRFIFDMIRGRPGGEAMPYSADQVGRILKKIGFVAMEFKPMGMFLNLSSGDSLRKFADNNRDTFCQIEIEMADCFKLDKAVMILIWASKPLVG